MLSKTPTKIAVIVACFVACLAPVSGFCQVAEIPADPPRRAIGKIERDALERIRRSIVRIETGSGVGSGFVQDVADGNAEVWTNAHVAGQVGDVVTVRFGAAIGLASKGKVIASRKDDEHDAAIIRVEIPEGEQPCPLGVCSDDAGGPYWVAGFPDGADFRVGIWQARDGSSGPAKLVDPAFVPGQSGSPVIDCQGNCVGVATMRYCDYQRQGFRLVPTGCYGGVFPIRGWIRGLRK